MAVFDSTYLDLYLAGVLAMAILGMALSVAVVARVVVSNRHVRLARHQSRRTYYGRLALHH